MGNRNASGEVGLKTHDILAENGFLYDSSLRGSDLPYRLSNGLIIVPSYYDIDDFHLFADYSGTVYNTRTHSPETGYQIWTNAFNGFYHYGLCYTTMFHPQVIGKLGGIMLLDGQLNYFKRFPRIWYETAQEIADHWKRKS